MDANTQVEKTKRALSQLEKELRSEGKDTAADALLNVLHSEKSVLRLAAILAPKN